MTPTPEEVVQTLRYLIAPYADGSASCGYYDPTNTDPECSDWNTPECPSHCDCGWGSFYWSTIRDILEGKYP